MIKNQEKKQQFLKKIKHNICNINKHNKISSNILTTTITTLNYRKQQQHKKATTEKTAMNFRWNNFNDSTHFSASSSDI